MFLGVFVVDEGDMPRWVILQGRVVGWDDWGGGGGSLKHSSGVVFAAVLDVRSDDDFCFAVIVFGICVGCVLRVK